MATQTRLLPQRFILDNSSRAAGRRGLVKAREALALAKQRSAAARRDDLDGDHATAA